MVEAGTKRTFVAAAFIIALLCSLTLFASSALAVPQAHSEAQVDEGSGLTHVSVILDSTAIGGSVKFAWLPINSSDVSVTAVINEFLTASENKVDRFVHDDYEMESMADFLSEKEYTVAVYEASAQQPGAEATFTSSSIGDESYASLETGDCVYVTVTK